NIVRAADIAAHAQEFSHPWNPNSLMRGTQLGRSVGLKRSGVNFIRVPAGKESFVYHSHRYEEEWMYVLSGGGIAFIDGQEFAIAAGDFMGFTRPRWRNCFATPAAAISSTGPAARIGSSRWPSSRR